MTSNNASPTRSPLVHPVCSSNGARPRQRGRPADRGWRQPRPARQRGVLRRPVRRQPNRGILRQDPSPPAQPRRRPPGQRRAFSHRPVPPALGAPHPRLPAPPHHRGKTRREAIRCLKRYSHERSTRSSPSPHQTLSSDPLWLDINRGTSTPPIKHPNVKKWLDGHPRFHLHFTPTSSSWLNLGERWFREITDKAIRRGVFHSVNELITAIEDYLKANNDNPKPFAWTATTEQSSPRLPADESRSSK